MKLLQNRIKAALNKLLMRPQIWQVSADTKQIKLINKNLAQSVISLQLETAIIQKKFDLLEGMLAQNQNAMSLAIDKFRADIQEMVVATLKQEEAFSSTIIQKKFDLLEGMLAQNQNTMSLEIDKLRDAIQEVTGATVKQEEYFSSTINRGLSEYEVAVKKLAENQFRQIEALFSLLLALKPEYPLPPTRNWAASPDFLIDLYCRIIEEKPAVVVELGSGVSTIVVAAALRRNQTGRLFSLDHDHAFLLQTEKHLSRHGLEEWVKTYHAPLTEWVPDPSSPTQAGDRFQWYDVPAEVAGLKQIDLLVVDGPPMASSKRCRYPAVPFFYQRLKEGGQVMLDDAHRDDERFIVKAWTTEFAMQLQKVRDSEKGLALLSKVKPNGPAQNAIEKV
ncbi:class I SAM-dependent methyltransferase [Aquamicrobium terrae]